VSAPERSALEWRRLYLDAQRTEERAIATAKNATKVRREIQEQYMAAARRVES
jgi:hypothetical protein